MKLREVSLKEYFNMLLTASDKELKSVVVREEDKMTMEELAERLYKIAGMGVGLNNLCLKKGAK